MGLFDFLKKEKQKAKQPEDYFNVTITDEIVTVEHPQRKKEQIKWTDIEMIKKWPCFWQPMFTSKVNCLLVRLLNLRG